MSGSKVNTYSIGDANIQALMLSTDKLFKGFHKVSLTNYDSTSESQIAAGSVIECAGALYKFDSNESMTGSPSDGIVYIQIVPGLTTCTAAYTNTAPTWSDAYQGWYGTGGAATYRYLEFILLKVSSSWSYKDIFKPSFKKSVWDKYEYIYLYTYNVNVNLGTTQTISSAGYVKLNIDTETVDYLNHYNTSTMKFTAKVPGTYLFSGSWTETGSPVSDLMAKKNGSTNTTLKASGSGSFTNISISLVAGDYIEFYTNNGSDTSYTVTACSISIVMATP